MMFDYILRIHSDFHLNIIISCMHGIIADMRSSVRGGLTGCAPMSIEDVGATTLVMVLMASIDHSKDKGI